MGRQSSRVAETQRVRLPRSLSWRNRIFLDAAKLARKILSFAMDIRDEGETLFHATPFGTDSTLRRLCRSTEPRSGFPPSVTILRGPAFGRDMTCVRAIVFVFSGDQGFVLSSPNRFSPTFLHGASRRSVQAVSRKTCFPFQLTARAAPGSRRSLLPVNLEGKTRCYRQNPQAYLQNGPSLI